MAYKYIIEKAPAKFLETIPKKQRENILLEIESLVSNPRKYGVIKLQGRDPSEYRTRIGDYRIVFMIEDEVFIIKVIRIFRRGDGY